MRHQLLWNAYASGWRLETHKIINKYIYICNMVDGDQCLKNKNWGRNRG